MSDKIVLIVFLDIVVVTKKLLFLKSALHSNKIYKASEIICSIALKCGTIKSVKKRTTNFAARTKT